jgi:hypothetical protein
VWLAWCAAASLSAQERIAGAPRRVWLDARWDSVGAVPRNAADTLLARPQHLVVADSLAVVLDCADRALKAFAPTGTLRWQHGNHGKGPAEIESPAALSLGFDGFIERAVSTTRIVAYARSSVCPRASAASTSSSPAGTPAAQEFR